MDILFNMQKIRFETLNKLFEKNNQYITADTTVHVFINLESIIRKVLSAQIDNYIKTNKDNEKEFVSNIFNIAAHYRLYFNKLKLNSKIYLYMGHPFGKKYQNESFVNDYREPVKLKFTKDAKGKYIGNLLNNTIPLIRTLFNYIEGVYLITSDFIEPSVIPKIIQSTFSEKDFGLVITTDRYDYQYAANGMDVIRSKGKDSYYINDKNVIEVLKRESKIVSTETCPMVYTPFILSFLDDKLRNIRGVKGVGVAKIIRSIQKGIEDNIISPDKFNFTLVSGILTDEIRDHVKLNYLATDVDIQYNFASKSMILPIFDQIVDLFDEVSLKRINEEYFINTPMMIMEIQPYVRKKTKNIFGQ